MKDGYNLPLMEQADREYIRYYDRREKGTTSFNLKILGHTDEGFACYSCSTNQGINCAGDIKRGKEACGHRIVPSKSVKGEAAR